MFGENRKNDDAYIYNNRHYYNGLNKYSQIIYDALVNNLDNIKSGSFRIEIKGNFSGILSGEDGNELLRDYYNDAVNAMNLDIPNLFYIDFKKMYITIDKKSNVFNTSYELYIDSGPNSNCYAEGFVSKEQIEAAESQIEVVKKQIKSGLYGTQYNMLKNLHDWETNYMEYDSSSTQRATVYGALIERKGVCEAYARLYKYIMDELGIENILVTGTGTNSGGVSEDHIWNYVKLDHEWYAVDVTWDDPIVKGNGIIGDDIKYKYFLVGSKDLFKNHTEKLTISPSGRIFSVPKLSISNYEV